MNRLFRWLWPLVALTGTVYAIWLMYFQTHPVSANGAAPLLVFIGCTYTIALLFLLRYTVSWTLRGLGQVATYTSDAGIYLGVGSGQLGWRHKITTTEINILWSGFVVGGSLLVIGLIWFAWLSRSGKDESLGFVWTPGHPNRREAIRREEDRDPVESIRKAGGA